MRPGFTERYHWQITRKKLKEILKGVSPAERQKALEARKDLLEEKYFWPMPAGMKTTDWIKEVQETSQSARKYYVYENNGKKRVEKTEPLHTKEKKIELLQNEYIFLTHEGDKINAELVKSALLGMGGQVFASLDVRDGAQPVLGADRPQGLGRPAEQPLAENEQLMPVLDDEQVLGFVALGEQYRVGNLIWSSVFHRKAKRGVLGIGARPRRIVYYQWRDAAAFCRNLGVGARLPTALEYMALGRAMGYPGRYNPYMIADMHGNVFWSNNINNNHDEYGFDGDIGSCVILQRERAAVRCVRDR